MGSPKVKAFKQNQKRVRGFCTSARSFISNFLDRLPQSIDASLLGSVGGKVSSSYPNAQWRIAGLIQELGASNALPAQRVTN